MNIVKSRNQNQLEYEILIRRRGKNEYASYCPQLNIMVKGNEHNFVRSQMKELINQHIEKIKNEEDDNKVGNFVNMTVTSEEDETQNLDFDIINNLSLDDEIINNILDENQLDSPLTDN